MAAETTSVSGAAMLGLVEGATTAGGAPVPAVRAPLFAESDAEAVEVNACATTGVEVLEIGTAPAPVVPPKVAEGVLFPTVGVLRFAAPLLMTTRSPEKLLLLTVDVPRLAISPLEAAEFPEKLLSLTVEVPPKFRMAPPRRLAAFPLKVLLSTVEVAKLTMAPPPLR
jgi:hypothetical protein